jgi:hypothetical protein
MSSAKPPRPTPPAHPTRQQLDDLEALMQRMLALPVNQLDGDLGDNVDSSLAAVPPIHVPSEWQTSEPEAAVLSTETARHQRDDGVPGAATAESEDEVRPVEESSHRHGEGRNFGPWPATLEQEAPEQPNIAPAAAKLTIVERPASSARPWKPLTPPRRLPLAIRPLVWVNRTFDRLAGRMGDPGRWLRGPRGRALLGWTGLVFLAIATAWAIVEWMGWTW